MDYLNGKIGLKKELIKDYQTEQEVRYEYDFSEVKGQENVKRALEVAAAGRTQLLIDSDLQAQVKLC